MCSAARRRFSISTMLNVIAMAHNSPIVRGCTTWYARTNRIRRFHIEAAVAVRDAGPCHAKDARIADERPVGELRQLAVETRRQVAVDLADLLFDHMIVVDQPLAGGRDVVARVGRQSQGPIGVEQYRFVIAQARIERASALRSGCDGFDLRQTFGVLFEARNAEQFLPNDRGAVPRRCEPVIKGYRAYSGNDGGRSRSRHSPAKASNGKDAPDLSAASVR